MMLIDMMSVISMIVTIVGVMMHFLVMEGWSNYFASHVAPFCHEFGPADQIRLDATSVDYFFATHPSKEPPLMSYSVLEKEFNGNVLSRKQENRYRASDIVNDLYPCTKLFFQFDFTLNPLKSRSFDIGKYLVYALVINFQFIHF